MKKKGIYFEKAPDLVAVGIKESLILIKEILTIGMEVIEKLEFKEQEDSKKDIRTAIIIGLFKEILERIDGILILLEKYSTLNANIILRSFMEILFDLKMILNNKDKKIVCYYIISKEIENIKKQEKLIKYNNENNIYIESNWKYLFEFIETMDELKKLRNKNLEILKKEFRDKKWYNLAGSKNKYKTQIDNILYGEFCKEIHGENILRDNYYKSDNIYEMRPLRFPKDYENIVYIISYNFSELLKLLKNEFNFDKRYIEFAEKNYEKSSKIFYDKEKHLKRN